MYSLDEHVMNFWVTSSVLLKDHHFELIFCNWVDHGITPDKDLNLKVAKINCSNIMKYGWPSTWSQYYAINGTFHHIMTHVYGLEKLCEIVVWYVKYYFAYCINSSVWISKETILLGLASFTFRFVTFHLTSIMFNELQRKILVTWEAC